MYFVLQELWLVVCITPVNPNLMCVLEACSFDAFGEYGGKPGRGAIPF
jgi:hypothetical protein